MEIKLTGGSNSKETSKSISSMESKDEDMHIVDDDDCDFSSSSGFLRSSSRSSKLLDKP